MAYYGNQCAMDGPATEGLALFARLPYGSGMSAEDSQFYLNNFNSQTGSGHVMTGSSYTGHLGFASSQSSPCNTHTLQTYPFDGQSLYTAPSQLEYQQLLAGVMEPCVSHCPSQGNGLVPIPVQENKVSPKHASRSNKIRNKIHELHPFYSRRLTSAAPQEGRTRTRDKYRVVYTEKQRVGLEKAYKEDKFITMAKKVELSKTLELSDRQIKIWFQNRRAKERRDDKRNTENIPSDVVSETKPSCRFERENVNPVSPTIRQDNAETPVQIMTSPVYGIRNMDQYKGYDSLLPQSTNFKMEGQDTSSSPEVAHTRFQMSPSEWMDAYHQPMINTVNISPFTSSLDVNCLPRV